MNSKSLKRRVKAFLKACTVALITIIIFAASGCSQGIKFEEPAEMNEAAAKYDSPREEVMNTIREELEETGFKIDKFDTEKGYLLTAPLRGGQFFEIWRKDNQTLHSAAYSSIQSIVRIGEFEFAEGSVQGNVLVKQLRIEKDYEGLISDINDVFTQRSGMLAGLELPEEGVEWSIVGRDKALEKRILNCF
ncbi:hypothetical protein L21SP3_00503 [Sedimentisphaera cyanobacteriorum]|uniref:Uncharacterized protein n=1 Tax=Sedimentisphaera cyanobacteriorum TaxID=1940790 RepID=A0A1Q2HN88_9BACT|nr:hypothetical protein [Sedimentisphaera cyanobacteriorum]AQQ08714.1 hypothetical protein L21SP3_00503 [Sedimentisphaera cyanobacteriorum]